MKTRRVGAVTCGNGAEMLVANTTCAENVEMKYDIPAVILVFILVMFALAMGFVEYVTAHYGWY